MRWLKHALRRVFGRDRLEEDMTRELRLHLEQQVAENRAAGMGPAEALRRARLAFGGLDAVTEACRDQRRFPLIEDLLQDLRFAWRGFWKRPAIGVTAVLTLSLAIGATTAVFSVVESFLLRPPPYTDPARLVFITGHSLGAVGAELPVSRPDLAEWRSQARSFTDIVGYWPTSYLVTGGATPERLMAGSVTDGFLDLLGVPPVMGRGLLEADHQPGADPVVLISFGLWQRQFGGRPEAVGETLTLGERTVTVVGVPPRDFIGPFNSPWDGVVPVEVDAPVGRRDALEVMPIARLQAGMTVADAQVEMDTLFAQLRQRYGRDASDSVQVVSLMERVSSYRRPRLLMLLGAVLLVLLIASTNVAGLLSARAVDRQRELGLRIALGAARARVVRQLLAEAAMLVALAVAVGLALASGMLALAEALAPPPLAPPGRGFELNVTVLLFAMAVASASALACGLVPALRLACPRLADSLKTGGPMVGPSRRSGRWRGSLATVELALSFALLIGAGLLGRDLLARWPSEPGFSTTNRLALRLRLQAGRYPTANAKRLFVDDVRTRLAGLSGVRSVSVSNILPFDGFGHRLAVQAAGQTAPADDYRPTVGYRAVTADHLQVMGIPVLEGRSLRLTDDAAAPPVAIVNQALRRQLFADGPAVGRQVDVVERDARGLEGERRRRLTVVGVAGNVDDSTISGRPTPRLYAPYAQAPTEVVTFVILAETPANTLGDAARAEVWRVDADQVVARTATLDQLVSSRFDEPRFVAVVMGVFAAIGMIIAGLGLYGTLSYTVVARFRELGIRIAVGARRGHVVRLIARQGGLTYVVGLGAGIAGAWALVRVVMSSVVVRVSPRDPATFLLAALVLAAVAALAIAIPVRRATKIDPVVALRMD